MEYKAPFRLRAHAVIAGGRRETFSFSQQMGSLVLFGALAGSALVAWRHGVHTPRALVQAPLRALPPRCCTVESLEKQLREANNAREDAEERVTDLKAELEALQQLFADESAAREELEVVQLQSQVGSFATTGGTAEVRELEQRLAAATQEASALRTELYRATADADDARQELQAMCELANQEEQALIATIEELTGRLRAAEAGGPRSADEQARTDLERIQQLEEHLGELLVAEEMARSELFQLRPKMAELEAELVAVQGQQGAPPGDDDG